MDRDDVQELYERMLLGLWHAEDRTLDERAASVAHDELIIHQNGERRHGAAALADLVRAGREPFTDVTVRIDTGPVIDGSLLAARWRFSGVYAGGMTGATAEEGTPATSPALTSSGSTKDASPSTGSARMAPP